jgi:hypothetical protein
MTHSRRRASGGSAVNVTLTASTEANSFGP